MKAIVSLKDTNGNYPTVGMSYRTVVAARDIDGIHLKAKRFAKGKEYKAEVYYGDSIYKDKPDRVDYGNYN